MRRRPCPKPFPRRLIRHLPDTLQGWRDRTLLLFGFAGGLRRSELCALGVAQVTETEEGLIVFLPSSKTDGEGEGAKIGLPYGSSPDTCPVRTYRTWLERSGLRDGPLFRGVDRFDRVQRKRLHPSSVARILKRAVQPVGLDPAAFAGHSLRAGFVTQAYLNDAAEFDIMRQTRHKSLATMRRYIRDGLLFRKNAATKLGL